MALALPFVASAQEPLTEEFTSDDKSLSFSYPAGWVVQGFGPLAIIANSQAAMDGDSETLTTGQVQIVIIASAAGELGIPIDVSSGISPEIIADALLQDAGPDNIEITQQPTPVEGLGQSAVMVGGIQDNTEVRFIIMLVDETNVIIVASTTPPNEGEAVVPTLQAIAGTITFDAEAAASGIFGGGSDTGGSGVTPGGGPAAVAGTGNIVWQQQREQGFTGETFGGLGPLAIGADDTIYVSDSFQGIRVISSAGELVGTIMIDAISNINDIEIAADGTLWLANGFDNQLIHVDLEGNVLTTFGSLGSEPGQFGDFSPGEFEIGPDGNIYAFDSQMDATTGDSTGRIQVFDQSGTFLREFPTDPSGSGDLSAFINMAMDAEGNLYMIGFFGGFTIMDSNGAIVQQGFGEDALGFTSVDAMAVGADGSVYVASLTGGAILKIDSTGTLVGQFGTEQEQPDGGDAPAFTPGEFYFVQGIAVLSNGDVVVADTNFAFSQIVRFSFDAESTGVSAVPETASETSDSAVVVATEDVSATGSETTDAGSMSGSTSTEADVAVASGGELRQWASSASATSEFSNPNWAASQATGMPNTPECGDFVTAWASLSAIGVDSLTVMFDAAVIPTQINIYQTFNPGSIVSVMALPAAGGDPMPIPNSVDALGNTSCPGVFTIDVPTGIPAINGVVINLDQSIGGSWNEIDAIELVGTQP